MIRDHSIGPSTGRKAECLVIFFHGYGSSGELMADYAGRQLAQMLPEAKLRFADGPIPVGRDQGGHELHSWFDVQDILDRPTGDAVAPRAKNAIRDINDYIDAVAREEGLSPDRIVLAGFSQGATMAFYAGSARDRAVAGIFSVSGGALDRIDPPKTTPPLVLVAGELEHSAYSGNIHAAHARGELEKKGFKPDFALIPGKYHDLSRESLELLARFVRGVASPARHRSPPPPGPRP